MTIPTGVQLKLDRAKEHLLALDSEIGMYPAEDVCTLVLNVQPSDQRRVLIEFHVATEPSDWLGVIIGDCLHNVRSALDHLAGNLVRTNGGVVDRETQFPILDRSTGKRGGPVAPKVSGGIDPKALAVVEALQPYKRGPNADRHPLAVLRELSNADKHRLLHLTAVYLTGAQCYLHLPDGRAIGGPTAVSAASHATPIFEFRFNEPFDRSLHGDMWVECEGATFVAVKGPGPWSDRPITIVLNEILEFVWNEVVAGLEPFLS